MHVMRAFIGVHGFQVHHVPHDLEIFGNAIAAVHVPRHARHIQRLAAVVALHQADHFRCRAAFVHQPSDAQRPLQAQRDLCHHIGKLQLEQLRLRQGPAELVAVQPVLPGGMPAEFCGPHHAPADAVARPVQAAERAFQTFDIRQQSVFTNLDILHHDLAGDAGPQRQLAADLRGRQALHPFFKDKALDLAAMRLGLCPDHEDIGDRAVGNPHLGAGQPIAGGRLFRHGLHARRVRPGIGFGQTETANQGARRQAGKVLQPLFLGAVGIDRIHDQAGLHAHHAAIAGIDPLHFPRDQAVGDVRRAKPAVLLRNGGTQQAHLAHFGEDARIGLFLAVGGHHPGLQLFLRKGAGGVAQHAFFLGQLIFQAERVLPVKPVQIGGILAGGDGLLQGHGGSSGGLGHLYLYFRNPS